MALTPVARLVTYCRALVKLLAKKERETWLPISLVTLKLALK